jgi:hypothetical protein
MAATGDTSAHAGALGVHAVVAVWEVCVIGRRATADQASRRTCSKHTPAGACGIDRTCTRATRFYTDPAQRAVHDRRMDVVAVVLGIVTFAILVAMIEGIDRI